MIPYTILAPHLDTSHAKLLRVAATSVHLPVTSPPADSLDQCHTRHILSVGKDGLDAWHDFGLIRVGANHGDLFTHRAANGRTYRVMVVEHPGAMQQLSFGGHTARDNMVADLRRWRMVLDGAPSSGYYPAMCGGCLKMREPKHRPAEHWVEELDGVGLCDDHWRKRAQYRRKRATVKVKDRGKMENQIPGQMEMLPGDGTKVRVSKR